MHVSNVASTVIASNREVRFQPHPSHHHHHHHHRCARSPRFLRQGTARVNRDYDEINRPGAAPIVVASAASGLARKLSYGRLARRVNGGTRGRGEACGVHNSSGRVVRAETPIADNRVVPAAS